LSLKDRMTWNHPNVVRRQFAKANKLVTPNVENPNRDGSLFNLAKDSAEHIGRVIGESVTRDKLKRIVAAAKRGGRPARPEVTPVEAEGDQPRLRRRSAAR
jgi:hypothetical protein